MPDQRSLTDQLQDLVVLANKNHLYDAADWVQSHLSRQRLTARVAARFASRLIISPEAIVHRALSNGLINLDEAMSSEMKHAAQRAAENISEGWPEGEGFGTSDMTPVMEDMLNNAGISTTYKGGRLVRIGNTRMASRMSWRDTDVLARTLGGLVDRAYHSKAPAAQDTQWVFQDRDDYVDFTNVMGRNHMTFLADPKDLSVVVWF